MKIISKLMLLLSLVLVLAPAQALLLEGGFTGVITQSSALGQIDGFANGAALSGHFYYDTDLAQLVDLYPSEVSRANFADQGNDNAWVGIDFAIQGQQWDDPEFTPNLIYDRVGLQNEHADGTQDVFTLTQHQRLSASGVFRDRRTSVQLLNWLEELITVISLEQSFSWVDTTPGSCGDYLGASIYSETCGSFMATYGLGAGAYAYSFQGDLTTFYIAPKTDVAVSESSILPILAFGLGLLALARTRVPRQRGDF